MPSMRRLLAVQAHLETTAATPEPAAATTELADLTLDDFMAMDKDRALLGKTFDIPTRREQAALRKQWIEERVTNILPGLMDEVGVEYWVLSMKEYGEDTAWRAMTPSETVAARRRSCIVYRRTAGGVEKETFVAKSDPALGWEGLFEEQVKPHLEEGGGRIAINVDAVFAFADGMHAGEKEAFVRGVGPEVMERVVSERLLPIYFLMLRAPTMNATPELPTVHGSALPTGSGHHYTNAVELSHSIIVEAMSAAVITPGSTTCADVSWWMWEKAVSLGFDCWFQPSFGVQRAGAEGTLADDTVIERGDFLWTDFGIDYAGLHTDMQHMGYVLHIGESGPPAGLLQGLAVTNRMQDMILEEMQLGRTGNEVLASFKSRMEGEGIDGTMYSHPIGDHGHAAGPLVGLADLDNEPVPVRGDVGVLRAEMWYAVELCARSYVEEWGQTVLFRQEENGILTETGNHFALYRQEGFHLVV